MLSHIIMSIFWFVLFIIILSCSMFVYTHYKYNNEYKQCIVSDVLDKIRKIQSNNYYECLNIHDYMKNTKNNNDRLYNIDEINEFYNILNDNYIINEFIKKETSNMDNINNLINQVNALQSLKHMSKEQLDIYNLALSKDITYHLEMTNIIEWNKLLNQLNKLNF